MTSLDLHGEGCINQVSSHQLGRFFTALDAAYAVAKFAEDPEHYLKHHPEIRRAPRVKDLYTAQKLLFKL